eukprot:1145901-Pelagomonas_calceolata.AAC.2
MAVLNVQSRRCLAGVLLLLVSSYLSYQHSRESVLISTSARRHTNRTLKVHVHIPAVQTSKERALNLESIHASRESISFTQPEHGMWPDHQMVLKCKLPDPSTTSYEKGTHMLSSGLRIALFRKQHA